MAAHHLPNYPTPFIGRTDEITDLSQLLNDPACRLLTLTGPGGIGKTRLAVEVARCKLDAFANGVYFVALQPLQLPEQVSSAIISTLSVRPEGGMEPDQALLNYLHVLNLFLLLDNFEHLLPAADLVASILNAAPQVKLLVTSREPLNLQEEWVRDVHGLTYPANGLDLEADDYSALQLFTERAQRLKAGFTLEDEYGHVARICQLVDGLPLALELAAGWLRTLSCAAIACEIEDNVDILAATTRNLPERHRSMRAVFDHSWQLLAEDERVVLPRFSVFRGGCTREAAEQVTGATLDNLAALVDKSLLQHDVDSGRYDMQELLRQYTHEQLEGVGEGKRVRDAHCYYFGALFHALEKHISGPGKEELLRTITAELDNIRASWAWALKQEHYEVFDQLVDTLWTYFNDYSPTFEMGALCQAASETLAACTGRREHAILGRVLARLGKWEATYSHLERAEVLFRQSMALALEQDDLDEYYYALRWLARNVLFRAGGESSIVRHMLEQCVAYYRERGNTAYLALSIFNLANISGTMGEIEQRTQLLLESYQLNREMDYPMGMAEALGHLGQAASEEGRWVEAERWLSEAVERQQQCGNSLGLMLIQAELGYVAAMQGDFTRAETLFDAALALRQTPDSLAEIEFVSSFLCGLGQSLIADASDASGDALRLADEVIASAEQRSGSPELVERGRVVRAWVLGSLEQFESASQEVTDTLSTQPEFFRLTVNLMFAFASAARILAHRDKRILAAELLGLVLTHPKSPQGYFKKHRGMIHLRTNLKDQLGAEIWAAAWARGTKLDVEEVARDLLREFSDDDPIAQANQALAFPLTPRELEVLALLAKGLTNPQIAERLFVTTGTVKSHTNKIYSKLMVESRAQAVTRARELLLL